MSIQAVTGRAMQLGHDGPCGPGPVACAFGPARQDHFYPLAPRVQVEPAAATPVAATLLVTQPVARGLSGGRELVFVGADRPGEVQTYTYHLWADPPAAAIASSLVAALRQAGPSPSSSAPGQRARGGLPPERRA